MELGAVAADRAMRASRGKLGSGKHGSTQGRKDAQGGLVAPAPGWRPRPGFVECQVDRARALPRELEDMREWTRPEIEEITLEPAEDVLRYCFSVSGTPAVSLNACTRKSCFTN